MLPPTIWPRPVFYRLVEAVAADIGAVRKREAAFERARTTEALSPENRFRGLLERHETRLRKVAFGMIGERGRVDDVLQEAFMRAYRKLPATFNSEAQEAAWLYRIVYRCCLNELRGRRRRRETADPAELDHRSAPVGEPLVVLAVGEALAELPPDLRAVVLLVDLIGFDYETAASALGIARGTVAWRLNAARGRLRAAFSDGEGSGGG
jgi:RNA polymerase sigma-70 factor (ECF subfamily)